MLNKRSSPRSQFRYPCDMEAEEYVLGSMIIHPESVDICRGILTGSDFWRDAHRFVWDAIIELGERGEPVEFPSIQGYLSHEPRFDAGADGDMVFLTSLIHRVVSVHSVEYYARKVLYFSDVRRKINLALKFIQDMQSTVLEDEFRSIVTGLIKDLEAGTKKSGTEHRIGQIALRVYEAAEERGASSGRLHGVPTPFRALNDITGGLQAGEVSIVAARPSVGKTSLALEIALHAALRKYRVGMFSLEMTSDLLTMRVMASIACVKSTKIRAGSLDGAEWEEIGRALSALGGTPILLDDRSDHSPVSMSLKVKEWAVNEPIDLMIVDYLGLVRPDRRCENRNLEIGDTMMGIKKIAKQNNCHVMLLHQLSRAVEGRADKVPVLSDLRDSGTIEQDADIVIFPYRPGYYHQFDNSKKVNIYQSQLTTLMIAKNRNGETGMVHTGFTPAFTKFSEWTGPIPADLFKGE